MDLNLRGRCAFAGVTGLLLLTATACGASDDDSTPETTPDPPATLTIDTLGDDDMVLRVGLPREDGSFEPNYSTLYADGTVIVAHGDSPTAFGTFHVSADRVARALERAAAADLYGDPDYGEHQADDAELAVVTANTDAGRTEVRAPTEVLPDLSDAQIAARLRLASLYDDLGLLLSASDARDHPDDLEPYVPDTIDVHVSPAGYEQLPGVDPDPAPTAWPIGEIAPDQWQVLGDEELCVPVPSTDLAGVLDAGRTQVWTVPAGAIATPKTVRVELRAQQPRDEPCDGAPTFDVPRPLTPEEVDAVDVDVPWTADARTTVHPLERWAIEETLVYDELPTRLPEGRTSHQGPDGWDRGRWRSFDVHASGTEVDGQRVIDLVASCDADLERTEPVCTIVARFDAATAELLEFHAT